MNDLVKRLRCGAAEFPIIAEHPALIMTEAADRIEKLQAQLEAVRKAHKKAEEDMCHCDSVDLWLIYEAAIGEGCGNHPIQRHLQPTASKQLNTCLNPL